ncbi:MAG: toprim domain-containing protein, partial [Oscillospiraceae bacterium]|nr:toprim domain-containing protein [Oscillospiraceae bacterium]
MIKIKQAIIVEGKYDKITLSSLVDAVIIPTNGFSIYKDEEKKALIQALAEKTGIVILTDSDSAGFQIRSHLRNIVKKGEIINVYIPDIFGKERRKSQPSKQGTLGVEGMSKAVLL